jgi:3-methyladenine DNA glycosylase/8-oxoguanine DNA glycosylase
MPTRTIALPGPVDLPLTLREFRQGTNDPTCRVHRNEVWRATRTPDGPATLHLVIDRHQSVRATAWGPGAARVLEGAPGLLGCDDDPGALETSHPLVRALHRRHGGLRIARTGNVSEILVPTILGQKVTGIEQRRGWYGLVRAHGERAPGPGTSRPAGLTVPPEPRTLARLPYFTYHRHGIERRRADTIRLASARAVRMEEASTMAPVDAERRLTALPGIGPWTAAMVRRVALGDPDAVEVGDFHVPNLVAWNLAGEPRGDDARMLELLEPFAGQRGRVVRLLAAGGERAPRYGPRFAPRDIRAI